MLSTQDGSISSISDLTPAAGWTVLDCEPDSREQVLRVVCHDPSKGCDHLYLNGAEHTFVRLPKEVEFFPSYVQLVVLTRSPYA